MLTYLGLCRDSFDHTFHLGGEEVTWKFSATTIGDLMDFADYYKYLPYHELRERIDDFSPELRDQLLIKKFEECSKRKAIVKRKVFAPIEKDEEGLPVKGAINKVDYVDDEKEFSFECPEVMEFAATYRGEIYQIFLSVKKQHPEVTLSQVKEIKAGDRELIILKLLELNGLKPDEEQDEDLKKIA